ncbi:hypothetical protein F5Y10DRAFT_163679 [Nemania abortiva]|nr:hypothetical protein F5Y10DRAFT_163679 [Nemania abortiva]
MPSAAKGGTTEIHAHAHRLPSIDDRQLEFHHLCTIIGYVGRCCGPRKTLERINYILITRHSSCMCSCLASGRKPPFLEPRRALIHRCDIQHVLVIAFIPSLYASTIPIPTNPGAVNRSLTPSSPLLPSTIILAHLSPLSPSRSIPFTNSRTARVPDFATDPKLDCAQFRLTRHASHRYVSLLPASAWPEIPTKESGIGVEFVNVGLCVLRMGI